MVLLPEPGTLFLSQPDIRDMRLVLADWGEGGRDDALDLPGSIETDLPSQHYQLSCTVLAQGSGLYWWVGAVVVWGGEA